MSRVTRALAQRGAVAVIVSALVGLGCEDAHERPWGLVTDAPPNQPTPAASPGAAAQPDEPAAVDFGAIAAVLQSPRCRNCHPSGDAPLQRAGGSAHTMNITRQSAASGLECATCHQDSNADDLGVAGGPPGAPHWGLPPVDTPMVFEGLSPDALCRQLRDPSQNGGRSLAELLAHVDVGGDPLVRWAWAPGAGRSVPALSHAQFVASFAAWVGAGGPCPDDPVLPPEPTPTSP